MLWLLHFLGANVYVSQFGLCNNYKVLARYETDMVPVGIAGVAGWTQLLSWEQIRPGSCTIPAQGLGPRGQQLLRKHFPRSD